MNTLEQKVYTALTTETQLGRSVSEVLYELACQAGFQNIIELSETDCEGDEVGLNTHFKNYKDALQHPEATIFVTNMSWMFYKCKEQSLDLSGFNTSNVTNMDGMFMSCQAEIINISNFDTSNVTSMRDMFTRCRAKTLDVSSFNTSNVINMKSMFYGCEAQTLELICFDTSRVEDMSWMFYGCKAQSINLSGFNISNVTNMFNMFKDCAARVLTTDRELWMNTVINNTSAQDLVFDTVA